MEVAQIDRPEGIRPGSKAAAVYPVDERGQTQAKRAPTGWRLNAYAD
jgi:hypothetical protein